MQIHSNKNSKVDCAVDQLSVLSMIVRELVTSVPSIPSAVADCCAGSISFTGRCHSDIDFILQHVLVIRNYVRQKFSSQNLDDKLERGR